MVENEVLKRFLSGNASAAECELCEAILTDESSGRPIEWERYQTETAADSLLTTIRMRGDEADGGWGDSTDTSPYLQQLVAQVEQMIPCGPVGQDELERILAPAIEPDTIGCIGRFSIVELIAAGGMGVVFRALDPELNRSVCIKVLNPLLASQPHAKQRFAREARASSRLQHERVVTVFEVGEHRELPFLVMELLEGESLRSRLAKATKLPPEEAVRVSIQVTEGLRYAHSRGFLHRDIKPDNIWLTPDGNVKILDFGLALAVNEAADLTRTGTLLGTPRYMSPEQVQSRSLTLSSDLFSLGSLIFEMLTGKTPFNGDTVFSTMMSVANDKIADKWQPDQDSIPSNLKSLVNRLLEKDPEERIHSAEELLLSLKRLDFEAGNPQPLRTSPAKRRWIGTAIAFAAGLAFTCLGLLAYQSTDRGTLVIEATPDVELTLKGDELAIVDPVSNKSYRIKIGSQKLPSGAYQLNVEETESGLTFSAEVIAIKRGEQTIVKISPQSIAASSEADDVVPRDGTQAPETLTNSEPDPQLKFDLGSLPVLDEFDVAKALGVSNSDELSPFALVKKPNEISNFQTWTLESAFPVAASIGLTQFSPDGKRIATVGEGEQLRIFDENIQCQLLLPAPDEVVSLRWAPDSQHLLAIYQGDYSRQAIIWRLGQNEAHMIRRIPLRADNASWSWDGAMIAFETEIGIRFYSVEAGAMTGAVNPAIQGKLGQHSFSIDGQFLALSEKGTVSIWDLKSAGRRHFFTNVSHFNWTNRPGQIVISRDNGLTRISECWDINEMEQPQTFDSERSWEPISLSHSPDFRFHAALSFGGELVVTAGKSPIRIPISNSQIDSNQDFRNVIRRFSEIQFSQTGDRIMVRTHQAIGIYEYGSFPEVKPVTEPKRIVRRSFPSSATHFKLGSHLYSKKIDSKLNSGSQTTLAIDRFDLEKVRLETSLIAEANPAEPHFISPTAFVRYSPDGTRFAIWDPAETRLSIHHWGVKDPIRKTKILPAYSLDLAWTADSQHLVCAVTGEANGEIMTTDDRLWLYDQGQQRPTSYLVFDGTGETAETIDLHLQLSELIGDRECLLKLSAPLPMSQGKLYVPVRRRLENSIAYEVIEFDLGTQDAKEFPLATFQGTESGLNHFVIADHHLVWCATYQAGFAAATELKCLDLDSPAKQYRVSRRRVTERFGKRFATLIEYQRDWTMEPLQSGRVLCTTKEGTYLIHPHAIVLEEETGEHFKEIAIDGNGAETLAWDDKSGKFAQLMQSQKEIKLVDQSLDATVQIKIPGEGNRPYRVVSTDFGWLVFGDRRWNAFSTDGTYLGCWIHSQVATAQTPDVFPTFWIGANGKVAYRATPGEIWFVGLDGNRIHSFRFVEEEVPSEIAKQRMGSARLWGEEAATEN